MSPAPRSALLVPVLACVIAVAGCRETKADDPELDAADGFVLHLPAKMQQALDSVAPGFRHIHAGDFRSDVREAAAEGANGVPQALFAVVGDFDGDGAKDVVMEGTTATDSALVIIAILNTGSTPTVREVARFPGYDASTVGIYLAPPVRAGLGAFGVVNYPDESTLYFYRDGKFEGMRTSG